MDESQIRRAKLAEALMRSNASRENYQVVPPGPQNPISATQTINNSNGYTLESTKNIQNPALAGYEWLTSNVSVAQTSAYSSPPLPSKIRFSEQHDSVYYESQNSSFNNSLAASQMQAEYDRKTEAKRLAERLALDLHLNRDFNKHYQILMENIDKDPDDLTSLNELRMLAKEFLDTAVSIGCIIINELFEENKTIPPVVIGGIAGGVKYIYRNILYKICLDTELEAHRGWMHGGTTPNHEKAMKTGAHELRGLMHYSSLRVSGLHFPLMLVMDYKGWRLVAEALLPINKETIVYGSSDGGVTVWGQDIPQSANHSILNLNQSPQNNAQNSNYHSQDDEVIDIMKTVGQQLHLAPHIVKGKIIYGPGDQEVHRGFDGRLYCIDLARAFPCEPAKHHMNPTNQNSNRSRSPSVVSSNSDKFNLSSRYNIPEEPRSIFYKFFRPEFILSYRKHLACDSFTAWGQNDPNFQEHNKDSIEACQHLKSFIIPKYATLLDNKASECKRTTDICDAWSSLKIIENLHSAGINVRHLGLVRRHSASEFVRKLLLNEMTARVIKNLIRKRLREEMKERRSLSNEQVKDIIISYYNYVLGKSSYPNVIGGSNQDNDSVNQTSDSIANSNDSLSTSGSDSLISSSGYEKSDNASSSNLLSHTNLSNARTAPEISEWTFPDSIFFSQFFFQFELPLLDVEMKDPESTIRRHLDTNLLFLRLNEMLGIEMDSAAKKELLESSYEFVHCDLSSIAPKIQFINLVEEAEGLALFITAKQKKSDQRKRLLRLATLKFQASCVSLPHNFHGQYYWGRALFEQAKLLMNHERSSIEDSRLKISYFENALERFEQVTKLRPGHSQAWKYQVHIWLKLFETPEYLSKLTDHPNDLLHDNSDYLPEQLKECCTKLMRLDILWIEKLMRKARLIFGSALRKRSSQLENDPNSSSTYALHECPTSLLKIVTHICVAIQTVSRPMIESMSSVPLPPDAMQIRLPRLYVESLLLCARSLQVRAQIASERAQAAQNNPALRISSVTPHPNGGINPDELHAKRLKFQIGEQFISALQTKLQIEDAMYLDKLIIESLPEIYPLCKSSKTLTQAFQERCRMISKLVLSTNSTGHIAKKPPTFFVESASTSSAIRTPTGTTVPAPVSNSPSEHLQLFLDIGLPYVGPRLTAIDVSSFKNLPIQVLTSLLERSVKSLTWLDISEVSTITNTWIQTAMPDLPKLQHLFVRDLRLTDESFIAIGTKHGRQLETLNAASNSLTDNGLYRMAKEFRCMKTLDLSGNRHIGSYKAPSNTSFADACSLLRPQLESFTLLECYTLANQAIWDICIKLTNLKHLAISSKQISDQFLLKMAPLALHLTSCTLRGMPNSVSAFKPLLSHFGPSTTALSLRACMGLTDPAVGALTRCVNLKVLHLGLCTGINGSSLETLSSHIQSLTELDLSGIKLDANVLVSFVTAQPNLEVLNISSLTDTVKSDAIFLRLVSNAPLLRELNTSSNPHLTAKSVEGLVKFTPKLESLNLADCSKLQNYDHFLLRLKCLTSLNIKYAHPPKYHCLLSPKFHHIKQLTTCQCSTSTK